MFDFKRTSNRFQIRSTDFNTTFLNKLLGTRHLLFGISKNYKTVIDGSKVKAGLFFAS